MDDNKKADKKKAEKVKELLPLTDFLHATGYSPEYLSFIAERKMLRAERVGDVWHTTGEWISQFVKEHSGKEATAKFELAQFGEDKKSFLRRFFGFALSAAVTVFVALFSGNSFLTEPNKYETVAESFSGDYQFLDDEAGMVKGEETENSLNVVSVSENFRMKEIKFGGDLVVADNERLTGDLEVADVRSENYMTKKQDESKVVLTWKTNRLSKSEVRYAKSGHSERTVKESNFGYNHSVIIGKLEQSSTYNFVVVAVDRWGNKASSQKYAIYTGSKAVSVFELISKELDEIFGWALK